MDPFQFHTGFQIQTSGSQNITDCPFCGKEKHFFYNEKHLWDCKVCGKSGNLVQFLRHLYDQFETKTNASKLIAEARGIPESYIADAGVKINTLNNTYIIPTYKNDALNNLYKVITIPGGGYKILATPDIEHTLMNWTDEPKDTIWICEGHWDQIAARAITVNQDITIIAVPGAAIWKPSWCEVLNEKDVVFCYDNDNPGKSGYQAVIMKHISKSQFKPKSISYIEWPEKKEGYDLNDAYREYGKGTFNVLKTFIKEFSAPTDMVVVKTTIDNVPADMSCDTFDKLLDKFKEVYHTTPDMEYALAFVLAAIYSIQIEGEQLWFRLIGPPGSGKTSIVKAVSGSSKVFMQSTFTGLVSGFSDGNPSDASMIPLLSGKALVVKDADALMTQPNIEKIFSEFRDFYDKDISFTFRNRVSHDYKNIRSSIILCGTNVLRRRDKVFLGERFLDCELKVSQQDRRMMTRKVIERSISSGASQSQLPPEYELMAAAKGFIEHLSQKEMKTNINIRAMKNVEDLAFLAATLRSQVDREKGGDKDVTFEPTIEVPTRISGQLIKLCQTLPVIYGVNTVDDRVLKGIYKAITDVIDPTSVRMRITSLLANKWMSRAELIEATQLPERRITRELDDMRLLEIVDFQKFSSGYAGAKLMKLRVKPDIADTLSTLEIG